MQTKTEQVRELLRNNREIDALRIAKSFRRLGDHKVTIRRAWDAYANPRFAKSLGRDPDALLATGVAAMRELYPV